MATETSASVYADDATVLLVKEKVWPAGPIYMVDVPWQRFALDDLSGIQGFLIEILTTPTKEEGGDLPANLPTKDYLRLLNVRSLRQAVERYKSARVRVADDTLVAISYSRNLQTKSWSETQQTVQESRWKEDALGAKAVLEALRVSE